jgi:hypothetical protein
VVTAVLATRSRFLHAEETKKACRRRRKPGFEERQRARGDRDVRGSVGNGLRGKKTPTLSPSGRKTCPVRGLEERNSREESRVRTIRQSGTSVVKTFEPPVKLFGTQIPRSIHAVKIAAVNAGNDRGAGARSSYGWQKSIGRIERLVRWEIARSRGDHGRALARRKLEAPPDAGHEQREGEPVREAAQTIKSYAQNWLVGFGSQVLETTEGALGFSPTKPLRAK